TCIPRGSERSAIERLDLALQRDQQRLTLAVLRLARGHLHPALADAVLLHVVALIAVQANADFVLEDGGDVMRALGVGGEVVGEGRLGGVVGHGGLRPSKVRGRLAFWGVWSGAMESSGARSSLGLLLCG